MRSYDEPIEVRSQAAGPVAFLWRQRLYVVRCVLGRWLERDAWWRRRDARLDEAERRVWRVEAGRGRTSGTGVYDLVEIVGAEPAVLVAATGSPATGAHPHAVAGFRSEPGDGGGSSPGTARWRLLRAVD